MDNYWSESQKNPIHNGSIEMSSQVKPSRQTSRKQSNRKIITRGDTSLLKSLIKLINFCDCSKAMHIHAKSTRPLRVRPFNDDAAPTEQVLAFSPNATTIQAPTSFVPVSPELF